MKEKKNVVKKSAGRTNFLKSILGRLVILGIVAFAALMILGGTGVYLLNSNNANSALLDSISEINLLQNSNTTAEVAFRYTLDYSYNDEMVKNIDAMANEAANAKKNAGITYSEGVEAISEKIAAIKSATSELSASYRQRGLSAEDGLYAEFLNSDAVIKEQFAVIGSEADWVEAPWIDFNLANVPVVKIDGKDYYKLDYNEALPQQGKRDNLIMRIGVTAQDYAQSVYATDIFFDDVELDISDLTDLDLSRSAGSALVSAAMADFDGKKAARADINFEAASGSWQDFSIQIPVTKFDNQNYQRVRFTYYMPVAGTINGTVCAALTGKYGFDTGLNDINAKVVNYSKAVAEGADSSALAAEIKADLAALQANSLTYTVNEGVISAVSGPLSAKIAAFDSLVSYDEGISKSKSALNALNSDLTNMCSDLKNAVDTDTKAAVVTMTILIVGILVASAVVIVLFTMFISFGVKKSISKFEGTLGIIAKGDMTARAKTDAGNEFDAFGMSLNEMAGVLQDTLGDVNRIADEVNSSGSGLQSMAESTSNISEQVSVTIEEIANGATAQAEDVEQSALQMSDLGKYMTNIVTNIESLDKASENMAEAGKAASEIIKELDASNGKMTSGISKIASQIDKTNESVQSIKDATSMIANIASQTNLLSLNASIEAARAGDAGKGFAVVASEIQQLADQSNRSAEDIDRVITALIADFKETLDVMNEVEEITNEQNEKITDTREKFDIVSGGITETRDKTEEIKNAIDECNRVQIKVDQLISNLSAISEEYAASTTEAAQSMSELNDTIQHLLGESNKLIDISNTLEESMKSFTL